MYRATAAVIVALLVGYVLWGAPRCTGVTPDDRCSISSTRRP